MPETTSETQEVRFQIPSSEMGIYFCNGSTNGAMLYRLDGVLALTSYTPASMSKREKVLARALLTLALEELDAFDA